MPELDTFTFTEDERRKAWARGYDLYGELPIPEHQGWKAIALLTRAEAENAQLKLKLDPKTFAEVWNLVDSLHGLVERLGHHYQGYLPHDQAPSFSNDTRTRLAFIEDSIKEADAAWSQAKALLNGDSVSTSPSQSTT